MGGGGHLPPGMVHRQGTAGSAGGPGTTGTSSAPPWWESTPPNPLYNPGRPYRYPSGPLPGYCFSLVTFEKRDAARAAVELLDRHQCRGEKYCCDGRLHVRHSDPDSELEGWPDSDTTSLDDATATRTSDDEADKKNDPSLLEVGSAASAASTAGLTAGATASMAATSRSSKSKSKSKNVLAHVAGMKKCGLIEIDSQQPAGPQVFRVMKINGAEGTVTLDRPDVGPDTDEALISSPPPTMSASGGQRKGGDSKAAAVPNLGMLG